MGLFRTTGAALAAVVKRLPVHAGTALLRPYGRPEGLIDRSESRVEDLSVLRPALCAPGSRPSWAGSRLTQVLLLGTALLAAAMVPSTARAVPAGTLITNTARAEYVLGGTPQTGTSNTVTITTVMIGSPSTLEVFRYAPSSPSISLPVAVTPYYDGGGFTPAPAPSDPATGTSIDLSVPVPLEPSSLFSQGEAVFLVLTDADGNADPAVADTLAVSIEDPAAATVETVLLTETGADTGVFTGYIRSGAASEIPNDGILYGFAGAQFSGEYTDPSDPVDTSSAPFLFDGAGVLWVTASAGKGTVSPGDYLAYTVTVENTSASTVPGAVLTTDLPLGFRYEPGSARINGLVAGDPIISPDGRSLAFSIGDLPPGTTLTVTMVARVGAGARPGRSVSPSVASSGLLLSNTAMAAVRVTEDLTRTRNVIMGRVLSGVCGVEQTAGVAGIRLFLEDGTYVVTDETGRYHFEGVRSGTHVVQMDLETVPDAYDVVACDSDTRQAGRPWSRFVDLAGGSLWRVDFYLTPKAPQAGRAVLVLRTEAKNNGVTFKAVLKGDKVPLRNARFEVTLPEGLVYKEGSARLEGEAIGAPEVKDGTLVFNVGDVPGDWERGITFETQEVDGWDWTRGRALEPAESEKDNTFLKLVQGEMKEVVASANLVFDTLVQKDISSSPVQNVLLKVAEREETRTKKFVFRPHFGTFEATLTDEDRQALDIISALFDPAEIDRVQVTGHTDNVPISPSGQRLYTDNYELSEARARSMARYLREVWGLASGKFIIEGKGPDDPLAANDTVSGRTLNRRVEVNVITTTIQKRSDLEPINDNNTTEILIKGLRPQAEGPVDGQFQEMVLQRDVSDPLEDMAWFESADGDLQWIWPDGGFYPSVPVTKVAVKHLPGSRVALMVNGTEVDSLTFEGTNVNGRKTSALSVWRGVRLGDGDNRLEAILYGKDGQKVGSIEKSVYLAGRPVKAAFVPGLSRLFADGRTSPQVAVRLTDSLGRPARPGLVGHYSVASPYRLQDQPAVSVDNDQAPEMARGQYVIGQDGIAQLSLQPTVRSGEAVLTVGVQGEEEEIRAWLTARRKEWVLVGLAEGTAGYRSVSGNMESFKDAGEEEDFYTDGRIAFFAKGQIKGKYLLTAQYDSNGPNGAAGEGLSGTIDPDTYFTLYGDATDQDYEAPTSKKLYLKIERDQFYALFGDTDTGLTVTELSRYDRRLTGVRAESRGETFSFNLFASETGQAFVKDEIPGDGTSGLYRLSAGEVVLNSESVRIEVRDRFQSHVVLSVQELARHIDYSIDYSDGTLFFKSPVPQRDAGFNPVYIVVDYETADPDASGVTYGGRAAAVLPGSDVTVGLSHIHEDRGEGEGNLLGLDVTAKLSEELTLSAETASTRSEDTSSDREGSAYILELEHESKDLNGKAYLREQDADFGLGQQMASEGGMRKAGIEGEYSLTQTIKLNAEAFRQENLESGAERHVEELGASLDSANTQYHASVRQATDTDSDATEERSRQVTAGVRWHSTDDRWELRAEHDQSLGDNSNTDYPTRTLLGADYRLSGSVTLYAEQEYTSGEETSVRSSRAGLKASPWQGGTASSDIDRRFDENGERVYATTGLTQTWQVSERWKVSAGLETAKVLKENTSEPVNGSAPPASPEEDYTATSLGAGYTFEQWDLDVRLEARNAESSDKWGVISGLFGEPADGVGVSADIKHFMSDAETGVKTRQNDARLGFVYRPFERNWTFLDKLSLSIDEEWGGVPDRRVRKLINNFNANLKTSDDFQVSFRHGAKQVRDTLDGQVYSGVTQLFGAEGRYDLTARWDIGAWTSFLTSRDAGTYDYGLGASLGFGLVENLWVSFGYNFHGFEDTDFSQGEFTSQGPFVKIRMKFDQEDLKGILKR